SSVRSRQAASSPPWARTSRLFWVTSILREPPARRRKDETGPMGLAALRDDPLFLPAPGPLLNSFRAFPGGAERLPARPRFSGCTPLRKKRLFGLAAGRALLASRSPTTPLPRSHQGDPLGPAHAPPLTPPAGSPAKVAVRGTTTAAVTRRRPHF